MPPRSRLWANDRSTISARRRIACLPTAEPKRVRFAYTAARALSSPCQREKPRCLGSAIRVFHAPPLEVLQDGSRVIPFVGDDFARLVLRRCGIDLRQVLLRRGERALDCRSVPVIGGMERCRDDDAGIEIDGGLRVLSPVRPTVLPLCGLCLSVGPADPLLLRHP